MVAGCRLGSSADGASWVLATTGEGFRPRLEAGEALWGATDEVSRTRTMMKRRRPGEGEDEGRGEGRGEGDGDGEGEGARAHVHVHVEAGTMVYQGILTT
jgi:hypothetical protein